ncbi:hypothetical protein BC830DRAFT_108838 [Chytriomyces sp. MP71]|nr:hypothetical protein BC830DRAFT_108838 [Chytriomyces sp. MP71]
MGYPQAQGAGQPSTNPPTSAQETAQLATDAFALAAKVLANEMLVASSDLRVLEDMNNAARERYAEVVDDTLLGVCASDLSILKGLNDDLDSFSTQVLLLERQIAGIEQVTTELDDYTKRLEDSVRRRIVYPFVTK